VSIEWETREVVKRETPFRPFGPKAVRFKREREVELRSTIKERGGIRNSAWNKKRERT
jgi:hypothetical protein